MAFTDRMERKYGYRWSEDRGIEAGTGCEILAPDDQVTQDLLRELFLTPTRLARLVDIAAQLRKQRGADHIDIRNAVDAVFAAGIRAVEDELDLWRDFADG